MEVSKKHARRMAKDVEGAIQVCIDAPEEAGKILVKLAKDLVEARNHLVEFGRAAEKWVEKLDDRQLLRGALCQKNLNREGSIIPLCPQHPLLAKDPHCWCHELEDHDGPCKCMCGFEEGEVDPDGKKATGRYESARVEGETVVDKVMRIGQVPSR